MIRINHNIQNLEIIMKDKKLLMIKELDLGKLEILYMIMQKIIISKFLMFLLQF